MVPATPDMPPCTSTEQEDMQLRKNATARNRPAAIRKPFLCLRAKSAARRLFFAAVFADRAVFVVV